MDFIKISESPDTLSRRGKKLRKSGGGVEGGGGVGGQGDLQKQPEKHFPVQGL